MNPDELPDGTLFMEGYDEALIGFERVDGTPVALYEYHKVIENLMEQFRDDQAEEDLFLKAIEFFDFNIGGAYIKGGPKFVCTSGECPMHCDLHVDGDGVVEE